MDASARVAYHGRYLIVEISTEAFGCDAVRTLADVSDIHPLREAATDPSTFELLDAVLALYTLDRSVRIRSGQIRRNFGLRLPVADTRRWGDLGPLLSEWFEALTGDAVEISTIQSGTAIADHHRRQRNFEFENGVDVVGLLSEGLDSLCGSDAARGRNVRIALASVITNPTRSNQISAMLAGIGDPRHYSLRTNLCRKRIVRERSQRSRTVLALVTGMTVAHIVGAHRVECYENGFGMLNLPVPDLQYGAMSSQVLSPRHLPLWDRVARAMFGRTIMLDYPNRLLTKAEMVSGLSHEAQWLVAKTSSCDRLQRIKGGGVLHCGTCCSCRYRQLAIASSGSSMPDVPYAHRNVGTGPDAELVLRYRARLLAEALYGDDPWGALVRLQPELATVTLSDDGRDAVGESAEARRRRLCDGTVELLRRHVAEVQSWQAVRAA